MNRAEKAAAVAELNAEFARSAHLILAAFHGLSVNQANELRKRVREAGGRYRVVKNRLAQRAAAGTHAEGLAARFSGPCAVAAHDSDPVAVAKALSEFAKANPEIELLGGLIDARDLLDAAQVRKLAALPGLNELRGQLLALVSTPVTTLVRLLGTPAAQLARVVQARGEHAGGGASAG